MSSDSSPPRVRQRTEESIKERRARMDSRQVLPKRNILRADLVDAPLNFIGQLITDNHWRYLYNYAWLVYPHLVQDFYGYMVMTQEDERGLIMQAAVRGHTFQIDSQLISSIIGVPMLDITGFPFTDIIEPPSIDDLMDFFDGHPQGEERAHPHIKIGAFFPPYRLLAKIVLHNLWPKARLSELVLKKARLLYAIVMRMMFCFCNHIMHTLLETRDERNTNLSFACLITQICLRYVTDIVDSKPRMRIQDPLGEQTLMKSNAQLRHEGQGQTLQPPPIQVDLPAAASSSQSIPPFSPFDAAFAHILASLSSLQREVNTIGERVEQCQIDIKECLKYHYPHDDDDND